MSALIIDTLAWALAIALCVPGNRRCAVRAFADVVVIGVLLHAPFGGTTALALLLGAFSSPAVTTLVVLAALMLARVRGGLFAEDERAHLALLFAVTGLAFYPPALGLGDIDPYAWGYGNARVVLCVGALAMLYVVGGRWVTVVVLMAPLVAWRLQWGASPNLWDYLLDPLLVLASIVTLVVVTVRRPHAAKATAPAVATPE